jgi:hypothetical protein
MVFSSFAAAQGWPGVPDILPLHPGWPPSDADLQPVLEDSFHFFYLSDLIGNEDAPYVQPIRLAAFNVAEAWIFAFLTRKTKELDHEKLVTVFHGSSLGSSSAIFIYGDCGSPYSSYKSY